MKLTKQLANRLKEVFLEGKWVTGTNFKDEISDLNWEQANIKIGSLNSIADLTFHIYYYIAGVLKVLEGGPLDIKDKYSFDAPPIYSNQDWKNLIDRFCRDSEKFVNMVENMPEEVLSSTFTDQKYGSYHRNIDVLIEHGYYHLGQIILIKKLIRERDTDN